MPSQTRGRSAITGAVDADGVAHEAPTPERKQLGQFRVGLGRECDTLIGADLKTLL
jgi:hypothetical protein